MEKRKPGVRGGARLTEKKDSLLLHLPAPLNLSVKRAIS
jgi:hypothetical protein